MLAKSREVAMPRVSASASSFMPPQALVPGSGRPRPPKDMTPGARKHWLAITNGLPANWFGSESLGMLKSLCCFLDIADNALAAANKALLDGDHQGHAEQVILANRATNAAIRLGIQLRVSPKSRGERGKAQNETNRRTVRPWEIAINADDEERHDN
jgi:hypothetical protein